MHWVGGGGGRSVNKLSRGDVVRGDYVESGAL